MQDLKRSDTRQLREFGLGLGLLLVLVFWLVLPWLGERPRPAWPLLAGGLVAALALAWPPGVLPVYKALRPVARLIGIVNTWLLLGAVFFGILMPLGLALRGLGRLQYRTGFDPAATTYRVDLAREQATRLEEPF